MVLTKDVGTFWKFPDDSLFYLIIGKFDDYYSSVYYDTLSGDIYYMTLSEDSTEVMVPSDNLEINNILIDELSKGGI
jgi:hypothetical protein